MELSLSQLSLIEPQEEAPIIEPNLSRMKIGYAGIEKPIDIPPMKLVYSNCILSG
jgi:hypothetical protein